MTCILDPIGCVLSTIPDWVFWALGAMLVLFAIGVLWRLKDFLALMHRIAGWPGVAAIVGAVAIIVGAFWPRKRERVDPIARSMGKDGASPRPRPKPPGDRKFNTDTNRWE